jgi:hypothetical protein
MKIYKAVQKLLVGNRQTGDLLGLLSCMVSGQKMTYLYKVAAFSYKDESWTWWNLILYCDSAGITLELT